MTRRSSIVSWTVMLVLGVATVARAADEGRADEFIMSLDGTVTFSADGAQHQMLIAMSIDYRWSTLGNKRSLTLSAIRARISLAGKPVIDYTADREAFVDRKSSAARATRIDDMPADKRDVFVELFGKPLCVLELDASGHETSRTLTMSDAARQLLSGENIVTNILFFHPSPPPAQDERWTMERTMHAGEAGPISGPFAYQRSQGREGATVYGVSGTLTRPDAVDANGKGTREYVFKAVGEQAFDPATRAWRSAKLDTDITFAQVMKGQVVSRPSVKMTYKVDPRPIGGNDGPAAPRQ